MHDKEFFVLSLHENITVQDYSDFINLIEFSSKKLIENF